MARPIETEDSDAESAESRDDMCREDLLVLNPFELPNFSKRKIRYMAEYDIEKWASDFGQVSFPTVSAPITVEEGKAVMHYFQEIRCNQKAKVTDSDEKAIGGLIGKIQKLIDELQSTGDSPNGFFVRLGPRSPKDAPAMPTEGQWGMQAAKIRAALAQRVHSSKTNSGVSVASELDQFALLHCFQDVCYSLLRVETAHDAIVLLVNSARVMQDISRTIDHCRESWNVSIAVRAWDNDVKLEREFRTFVIGGKVVAISQYDDQMCYPFVTENAEQIVAEVVSGMQRSRSCLEAAGLASPDRAVVVDFVLVPRPDGFGAWDARVIELNPFGPMTGACLFVWTVDRRLLQGGSDLFGDLEACEKLHQPGSMELPAHVTEAQIMGIPFRYLHTNPPKDNDHVLMCWGDYMSIASQILVT